MATVNGTSENDNLGYDDGVTDGEDIINGLGGSDTLQASGGGDQFNGGTGNDAVSYALSPSAVLVDLLNGGLGGTANGDFYDSIEQVEGSDHDDLLIGDESQNTLRGRDGDDTLRGGGGHDSLYGGEGEDDLFGGDSFDSLHGGPGNDILDGGNDGDALEGWFGDDTLLGGDGDDFLTGSYGGDRLDGGDGVDRVNYLDSGTGVTVAVNGGAAFGEAQGDILIDVENIYGSQHGDVLIGDSGANRLSGNGGDDQLTGEGGDDELEGDLGADIIDGGDGADELYGGADNDSLDGGTGDDTLEGYTGDDALTGSDGMDSLSGSDGNDTLSGGAGDDTLAGGVGADTLAGGAGDDAYINIAGDSATELAGEGIDTVRSDVTFTLADHFDNLTLYTDNIGASGGATGTGNALANRITGNALANTLLGLGGADRLVGADGNDTLTGGLGDDKIEPGAGADLVYWTTGDGSDLIDFGAGADLDTLQAAGSAGDDSFDLFATGATVQLTDGTAIVNVTGAGTNDQVHIRPLGGADRVVVRGEAVSGARAAFVNLAATPGVAGADGAADEVAIHGTAAGDTLIVTGYISTGISVYNYASPLIAGVTNADSTLDRLIVEGGAGNDYITAYDDVGLGYLEAGIMLVTFSGGADNDGLIGGAGAETLDGGSGNDQMEGGPGDDIYVVDAAGDIVTEGYAVWGIDTVRSAIDYTLGAHVENLVLEGAALTGTGNELANTITGNAAANTLSGLGGIDTLTGGAGNDTYVNPTGDTVIEAAGQANGANDLILSNASYNLASAPNVEDITLTGAANINAIGSAANNRLTGNAGNNILNGGNGADTLAGNAGADTLNGGAGNDIYVNPESIDTLIEAAGASGGLNDRIQTISSFSLASVANIEDMLLAGGKNINAIGNNLNNMLTGNSGANILNGGGGADTLTGAAGNDTMNGGTGADLFKFAAANTGADTINAFETSIDRFNLSGGLFSNRVESAGSTTLTHTGGTIVMTGITGLTLAAWNALVVSGMRAAPDAFPPPSFTGEVARASATEGAFHLGTFGAADFLYA